MSITFKRQKNELILVLSYEVYGIDVILDGIEKNGEWNISHCFKVDKGHLREVNDDNNELRFCVGTVYSDYTQIDRTIIGTIHTFYFDNNMELYQRHFVAYRNISILSKIDSVVDKDVYIGGKQREGYLPAETFEYLIEKFPKTTELNRYADSRIASIVKEFYPVAELCQQKFEKYIGHQDKALSSIALSAPITAYKKNVSTELRQFNNIRSELHDLLLHANGVNEQIWQEQIHGILRLLYPKYIAGIREVTIKGSDKHDKRPDFLLVDANGYIDILEIKKPDVQLLTRQSSYRDNFVPVRELSGAIQQIEKYIYCLNSLGYAGEIELQKQLAKIITLPVMPKVVNPQGILLLGRSDDFDKQQKSDFELIKRQYKHITDIMTYDDLLQRLDNIIDSLSREVGNN